jgi:SAM-dependent methyltransferase
MLSSIQTKWNNGRSWLYDTVIVAMTTVWYRTVLTALPMDAEVLDVGIGTATSLLHNRDLIVSKRMRVVGVDYDAAYIDSARLAIAQCKLQQHVDVKCSGIENYIGGPFDAVYFSGSFMILPDKMRMLQHCHRMLKDREHGRIYFTQTLEKRGLVGSLMHVVKPILKLLTTIDFGGVTYEDELVAVIREAGLVVVENKVIAAGRFRSSVMITAARKE